MAKKRTPVQRLDVSSISTKPIASPVDTYVPPAQEQTTLSPLSQFVNAITPAVQAAADKQLEEKLKRERRIENFNFTKKQNQVKTEALVTHSQMVNSYKRNPEAYINTPDEAIIADIDNHTFNYVEKLRDKGVDELHIETYKADMEERKIKFLSDITDAKKSNVITQENIKMRESFIALDTLNKENPIKAVELAKDLVDTHAKSFPTIDGKPDYKRVNKILLGLADDVKESNPNNIYLAALEELKQLDTSENLDKGSELRAKRDTFIAKANKGAAVQLRVQEAINKGTRVNTLGITASQDELSLGLLRSTVNVNGTDVPFTKLNPKQQADQYRITGILPEVVTNVVKSTIDKIRGGTPNTEESNEALRLGFQQYQILKAAGIPTGSYLKPEEEKLMEGLDLLIVREAKQPQFIAEKPLSEEDYTTEVDYNQANYVSAASILQGYDKNNEPEMTTALAKKVTDDLTSFFGTAIDDLPTSSLIFKEAIEDFRYFRALGNDEKTSIEKAIAIVNKNYPIIESAGNKNFKYGFPHLYQNVPMGLKPEEVIPKINKSLVNNPALQKHILATQGLEAGTYDISLVPNPINPVEVGIRVTDNDGNFTNILGMFDKVKILSDPKILYNMVAKDLARAEAEPLENSVESLISFDSDERRERAPKKFGDDFVDYIAGSPEASLNLIKGIGDTIIKATESKKDFVAEAENVKKFGDDLIEYIKGSPEAAINNIRALFSGDLNVIKPAGASTLDETQVGEFTPSNMPSNQAIGNKMTIEGSNIEEKTANMIATQEGFSSTPYKDGKNKSVGFGFYLPALEDDEKALIKDINNVTKEEATQVLKLKVQKIGNYLDKEIQGFRNIPEEAQSAIISMGYQLGVTNIPKTWKKFTAAIKEAGQYEVGSPQQEEALAKAKFEMLYSRTKDGKVVLNKWAKQTKERAFEMANAVSDVELSL
jgi:GH24 family phage-related lysozyme (muramidase)